MKEIANKIITYFKNAFSSKENAWAFVKKLLVFLPPLMLTVAYIILISTVKKLPKTEFIIVTALTLISIASSLLKALDEKLIKNILGGIFLAVIPYLIYVVVESFLHNKLFFEATANHITYLNVLFYYLFAILLLTITTRLDVALILTTLIPSALGIANYMSLQARDLPIYPWDILSAGTAMSVLDNYKIIFSPTFKFCIFCVFAIVLLSIQLNFRFKFKKLYIGIIPALAAIICFVGYIAEINDIFKTESNAAKEGYYPYLFSATYLYKHNGTPVTFIYTLKYLKLSPPQGYDVDDLKDLYEQYKAEAEADAEAKDDNVKPNIIVIMNEAFSEPGVLGSFTTNVDYMPFIHSIMNGEVSNTDSGYLYVSVKGGNTPNSEFEFLTGTSMAFLPTGSIPYQQFLHEDTLSIVSQLNSLGYKTIGMHNYYGSGWQRDEVYEYFGFDEIIFNSDFKNKSYIRSYLSDRSMYNEIIRLQNEKAEGEPLFVFGVTMQNHGDYPNSSNKNFIPNVKVLDNDRSYISYLNNYLSLLYESDVAFENLVEYYSTVDEPTVIIMFGDHQTNDHVMYPILSATGIDMANADLETQQQRYKTPYIMWSNYDMNAEKMPDEMSLSYLGGLLMDACGIPLTPFQIWQKELIPEYPIVNAFCYVDKYGNFKSIADIESVPMMSTFSKLQYNLIFDRKHTVKQLFQPVIK